MAIRQIRQKGDEILTKKARPIEKIDDKIKELAQDMLDTMYASDGIGLAACQVGMLKSMIVYDVTYIEEDKEGNPLPKKPVVFINPVLVSHSKSMVVVEEGCLSFPNVFEEVKRYEKVKVEYTDLDGNRKTLSAKGIEAVCIQHEMDHLDGIVFLDRVEIVPQEIKEANKK